MDNGPLTFFVVLCGTIQTFMLFILNDIKSDVRNMNKGLNLKIDHVEKKIDKHLQDHLQGIFE